MAAESTNPIEIFYSYAHEDEPLRQELEKHLALLKQQGLISGWHDRSICPGTEWSQEIDTHLNSAHLILLLISASFLASNYCYHIEMKRALERHEAGEARVIPIILRPVNWEAEPSLSKLQALPTDAKPVTTWPNPPTYDEAFLDIEKGIRKVVLELNATQTITPRPSLRAWNVPFSRNPYFTGREDILKHLHDTLTKGKTAALTQPPQAISGLGGIGKTQTAVEYAYRYGDGYKYVFWVPSEKREELNSGFVTIAEVLNLPEKNAQDQSQIVAAVKRWLQEHTGWLLILDNADVLEMAREFLPTTNKGHILLTTRAQAMGQLAQKVEIEKMDPEEGALFLLRRAGIIVQDAPAENASAAERARAREIVEALDGLPLALDQAGAYIEETDCGLTGYLSRYRTQRTQLLKRRGGLVADHREPVATTWKLSFEKVEQASPAAADLLRLCAFLTPDAIPEEIVTEGASDLTPALQAVANNAVELDTAIEELRKYSLVRRDPDGQTLTIHRLVQAVLKDEMNEEAQPRWAERVVRAVNHTFPDNVEYETWPQCRRLLPQAQVCAELIEQWGMAFPEAARLLNQAGVYLKGRAQYTEAELLCQRALAIYEKALGPEAKDVASGLNNLATLYYYQGRYVEAEPLFQRALAISEKALGLEHPTVGIKLNNLALLYEKQGKYAEAEPLFQRALAISEKALGLEHPIVASRLNNLALLYSNQGKYVEAEPLYQRALGIDEKALGPDDPRLAIDLNNLALLYSNQGRYAEAEPLYQRALAIWEQELGSVHPLVATGLNNLALLCKTQGRYAEAEQLYQRAIAIDEKVYGPNHPDVATDLENYAELLRETKRADEAAKLEARAKAIREKHAQENPMQGE